MKFHVEATMIKCKTSWYGGTSLFIMSDLGVRQRVIKDEILLVIGPGKREYDYDHSVTYMLHPIHGLVYAYDCWGQGWWNCFEVIA